jgi:hypothetical protein
LSLKRYDFDYEVECDSNNNVTATQTASNGILLTASTAINVPVSDPIEEKEGGRGEETPQQAANITVNPNVLSGAISPFRRPLIPVIAAISDFNPNIPYGGRAVAVDVSPTNSAVTT